MYCKKCGVKIEEGTKFCQECGTPVDVSCAAEEKTADSGDKDFYYENENTKEEVNASNRNEDKNKITAGILAIILGSLGIHKFYLGYKKSGIIMLICSLVGVLIMGIPTLVMEVIGIIEGIAYLTSSDEAFYNTYIKGNKEWF